MQGANRQTVRLEHMMAHRDGRGGGEHQSRRVSARAIAQTDEALRLVERDEILHAVAETARADGDICFKPLWAVRIGPRAAIRKRLRIIPVEQRDKRADAVGEQRVNQAVVKRDALLVDRVLPD